jgi:Arc/MetJ-type ribon-helix-helix transcriptional regulator
MAITLRSDHEQRFLEAVREGGFETADDAMDAALEMLRAQNKWLRENRTEIQTKIAEGLDELDRGEGIPEARLTDYL